MRIRELNLKLNVRLDYCGIANVNDWQPSAALPFPRGFCACGFVWRSDVASCKYATSHACKVPLGNIDLIAPFLSLCIIAIWQCPNLVLGWLD
jgi:hypothetical protein